MNSKTFYLIVAFTNTFSSTMQIQKKYKIKVQKPEGEKKRKTSIWRKLCNKKFLYSLAGGILGGYLIYSSIGKRNINNYNQDTQKPELELDSSDKYNYGLLEGDFSGNIRTEEEAKALRTYIKENPDKIVLSAALAYAPASLAGAIPARFKYFKGALKALLPTVMSSKLTNPLIETLTKDKTYGEALGEEILKDSSKSEILKEYATSLGMGYTFGKVFQGLKYLKKTVKPRHIITPAIVGASNVAAYSTLENKTLNYDDIDKYIHYG
jgi:hypothetical protein